MCLSLQTSHTVKHIPAVRAVGCCWEKAMQHNVKSLTLGSVYCMLIRALISTRCRVGPIR